MKNWKIKQVCQVPPHWSGPCPSPLCWSWYPPLPRTQACTILGRLSSVLRTGQKPVVTETNEILKLMTEGWQGSQHHGYPPASPQDSTSVPFKEHPGKTASHCSAPLLPGWVPSGPAHTCAPVGCATHFLSLAPARCPPLHLPRLHSTDAAVTPWRLGCRLRPHKTRPVHGKAPGQWTCSTLGNQVTGWVPSAHAWAPGHG